MCEEPTGKSRVLGLRLNKSQGLFPRGKSGIAVTICQCGKCGLIYADPLPLPQAISDHYGLPPESYWNSVSYDPEPGYFAREIETAKALLKFSPGMNALDVGLGLGKGARVMESEGFKVYGCEPSYPFYSKALELLGGDTKRFKHSTIEEVDFPAGQFDLITFGAVLEHLFDPHAALVKAMRWLKPGGIVHAEVPNARHLVSKIINNWYRISGSSFVTNTSPMHIPFHLYEFSFDTFRLNGEKLGYTIVHHWIDVCSIFNIPQFLHPPLRIWMERTGTGMQLSVFLRKSIGAVAGVVEI